MRPFLALLSFVFLAVPRAGRADDVSREFMLRYNELALRAEKALTKSGPEAAIRVYEEGLLDPEGEYGRLHLRLGQLNQQLGRNAAAALHYRACDADERVDAVDRELICREGLAAVTAPLTVGPLPVRAKVVVVEPEEVAGPVPADGRLPKGTVRLLVEAPGRQPQETAVELKGPLTWTPVLGPPRAGPANPDDETPPDFVRTDVPPPAEASSGGIGRWPAYATGAAGVALVGVGLWLGFDNRNGLGDIRADQRNDRCGADRCRGRLDDAESRATLADGLWIGGAALTAGATALFFLLSPSEPTP